MSSAGGGDPAAREAGGRAESRLVTAGAGGEEDASALRLAEAVLGVVDTVRLVSPSGCSHEQLRKESGSSRPGAAWAAAQNACFHQQVRKVRVPNQTKPKEGNAVCCLRLVPAALSASPRPGSHDHCAVAGKEIQYLGSENGPRSTGIISDASASHASCDDWLQRRGKQRKPSQAPALAAIF
jgi:hypothetical protein